MKCLGLAKKIALIAALLGMSIFVVVGCEAEDETIMFGGLGWDSAQFHNQVARYILEHGYGYDTDEIPGETMTVFSGLERGDIDVVMEIWPENQKEAWEGALEDGSVEDLGVNFPDSEQGFYVPAYVVEGDEERGIEPMAEDLESIYDMCDYWELFQDPENPDKGRFYTGLPGWEATKINEAKFEAYGLKDCFELFGPGTQAALDSSLVSAYERGEPWFGYYWAPTPLYGKLDLYKIEEPEYDEEVWGDTYECDYPYSQVHIAVYHDFPDRHPEIVEFLENYETDTEMVSEALAYMDELDVDPDQAAPEAAKWFLREREDVWTQWVSEDVAESVKDSLN